MLAEFSISPLDKGISLSKYVARSLELIEKSGLPYKITPMGTIVEGDVDEVFDLIKRCHKRMREDCERVSTYVRIDDRTGATGRIEGKVKAVEKHLGRELKK